MGFGLDGSMWLLLLVIIIVAVLLYMSMGDKPVKNCNLLDPTGAAELSEEDELIVDC